MYQDNTLLRCVDCGYQGKTFDVAIVGSSHGAFTYGAQCPICDSKKVRHVTSLNEPELEISITADKKMKISNKQK